MTAPSLLTQHVRLMASYNQWMNKKVYETAGKLTAAQLAENRGAFFGSVLGTLNHIMVGDTVWMQRFAGALQGHSELDVVRQVPTPQSLDAVLFDDFTPLLQRRELLDETILGFASSITDAELSSILQYKNMRGVQSSRQLFNVLMHFFNHQTHHRGQVTTLLTQCGLDVGVTDLLMLIPEI